MEKNATSAVHFRTKLLTAACQMQSALCIQDLGQLYHKPLRDSQGTVVLACVNNVKVSVFYYYFGCGFALRLINYYCFVFHLGTEKCFCVEFQMDTVK